MSRKKIIIIGIAVVVVILASYFIFFNKSKSPFQTVTVTRGNISEEVSVTGNVQPLQNVDLAFEKTGRIAAVNADVGDKVYAGEAIVRLDKSDLVAQLAKAEADLATQNASLAKAQVDLANYYGDVINILNDAYNKSDDAVRIKTSALFTGSANYGYQLNFTSCDSQAAIDTANLRLQSEGELRIWQSELAVLSSVTPNNDLSQALLKAGNHLNVFKAFLERTYANFVNPCLINNTSYDTARANLTTARANINIALTNVLTQSQSITAQNATVASLTADVKSYEASIANIQAQIDKMTIYAPIDGVVSVQNAKVGEIAGANGVIVSIISAGRFNVEANVAEADIAKVKIGDSAQITFDAYGNDVIFDANVYFIDPAETKVEGVATYKTKFRFSVPDSRIKSGLTANITVFTNKKENVLVIPQRVVTNQNGTQSVRVDLGKGLSAERQIQTGLKGVDGNVEVVSGLNEGDRVIITNS